MGVGRPPFPQYPSGHPVWVGAPLSPVSPWLCPESPLRAGAGGRRPRKGRGSFLVQKYTPRRCRHASGGEVDVTPSRRACRSGKRPRALARLEGLGASDVQVLARPRGPARPSAGPQGRAGRGRFLPSPGCLPPPAPAQRGAAPCRAGPSLGSWPRSQRSQCTQAASGPVAACVWPLDGRGPGASPWDGPSVGLCGSEVTAPGFGARSRLAPVTPPGTGGRPGPPPAGCPGAWVPVRPRGPRPGCQAGALVPGVPAGLPVPAPDRGGPARGKVPE